MARENQSYNAGGPSGFMLGALVGAGIALLLAPYAGSELRRLLREYAACAKDELADGVDRGVEAVDKVVDQSERFMEKGKKSFSETDSGAKT